MDLLDALGKHTVGKGCLYLKKLSDAAPAGTAGDDRARLGRQRSGYDATPGRPWDPTEPSFLIIDGAGLLRRKSGAPLLGSGGPCSNAAEVEAEGLVVS